MWLAGSTDLPLALAVRPSDLDPRPQDPHVAPFSQLQRSSYSSSSQPHHSTLIQAFRYERATCAV